MRRQLVAAILLVLAWIASASAQSTTIPGWKMDRLPHGVSLTSPADAQGRAVVYYQLYVEPYTGSFRAHFTERVDRIAGGLHRVNSRHGTTTEELALADGTTRTIWQDALNATNAEGVTGHLVILGWRVGTSQSQMMIVMFHNDLDDSDPMVVTALDHVGSLWKAGRGIAREAAASPPPQRPQPVQPPPHAAAPAPPVQPQAATPAARPCVPKPVRMNFPRAVSRQQCGYLGGQYRCTLVTDYVDNYVTVHTGCP